jgi:histidyl-tRNA synthetase
VKDELRQRDLNETQIATIEQYLLIDGTNEEKIIQLKNLLGNNETGLNGIAEIEHILNYQISTTNSTLITDFTLARGLNYYTGVIFEIKAKNVQMGSIGGGGRYDDLTGTFGLPNVPGVGISFGVDRIYDVLEELSLFPENVEIATQILFFNLGIAESKNAFTIMQQLRAGGIRCEMYHELSKFDKQFKYAEKKNIPYIVIIGTKEMEDGNCTLKDLRTGNQKTIPQQQLVEEIFS